MTCPLVPEFKNWPSDPITSVEQKFLTKMPKDFMAFWEFCKSIDRENPREALLKSCGLLLVGPFDIVAGQEFESNKLNDFLCHYRYYRDPPEFQTVIARFVDILFAAKINPFYCYFCLVLLQVPKYFGPIQMFWARPKIDLHLVLLLLPLLVKSKSLLYFINF